MKTLEELKHDYSVIIMDIADAADIAADAVNALKINTVE